MDIRFFMMTLGLCILGALPLGFVLLFIFDEEKERKMRFNINDHVKVKLTEKGKSIFKSYKRRAPEIDKEGYTEFQMHALMNIYGEHLFTGCELPFDLSIIIIEE